MTAILTDSSKLSALIASIGKASTKLDKDIQQALGGVAFQAIEHGNTTPLNKLFTSIGKGTRRTAIAGWIVAYCPVTQNTSAETKAEQPFNFDKAKAADIKDVEGATNWVTNALLDNWTEFAPEPSPVTAAFDLRKQLTALLNKVAKASKDGRAVEGIELVAALSKLCETPEEEAVAGL